MEKKGGTLTIILAIVILIIIGIIVWQAITIINKLKTNETDLEEISSNGQSNATLPETNETNGETNDTLPANGTDTNQTETNETDTNQTSITIPNPTGSITNIDYRDDNIGGYFCDEDQNPKHGVRLYTYKTINGTKNLSENYIESDKIDDVCSTYGNVSGGINYYMEWKWDSVEGTDGYKISQYYSSENISRNYDYYIYLKTERLIDTGLNLWKHDI